jgi:hypothetical protein
MIITMQGNWTIAVKTKNASYAQRFMVQGAVSGNGTYDGTVGTTVNVVGSQWSISVQNKPSTGWQASQTKLKFPQKIAGKYEFEILSNDAGNDSDFDDLILTCSAPININDFIIFGNVTLYSGNCIFNPCRKFPYVIDTLEGLRAALKNPTIGDWIKKYYPERIPEWVNPNPPDPAPDFKPIVFDLGSNITKPKTTLSYVRNLVDKPLKSAKNNVGLNTGLLASDFSLLKRTEMIQDTINVSKFNDIASIIDGIHFPCFSSAGSNLTLSFEEYDRTAAELSGGVYTGTGNRRILGDAITDTFGNYIFRFSFDMTLPGLEDASDIAPGEDVNSVVFPDLIVKVVEYSPYAVKYESAPFFNISNLKRIDLCLPESKVKVTSACFNGNLIGSLGNVFVGGNQNSTASFSSTALRRHGYSNYLEETGVVSVNSPLAGFNVECAAWGGTIDMKGCMYDIKKTASDNKIKWYTIRVMRAGTLGWQFVSQNYKHPKFSKRNLPNYIGDDVGPFYPNIGGTLTGSTPAYINIQREIFADGIDWEFSNLDRYMQLNTTLYDVVAGVRTPGKFYLRIDGYDANGNLVPNATDMIAMFIHNNGLNFAMSTPSFTDNTILNAGCGLFRLNNTQLKTPIQFNFKANDPYGFVDNYALTMGRCPGTALNLTSNIESAFTLTGGHTFPGGNKPSNVHNLCPGYTGTQEDYSNNGLINVQIQPPAIGEGWIKTDEYFTIYSFGLTANHRVTNGYNNGISGTYQSYGQIMMERLDS